MADIENSPSSLNWNIFTCYAFAAAVRMRRVLRTLLSAAHYHKKNPNLLFINETSESCSEIRRKRPDNLKRSGDLKPRMAGEDMSTLTNWNWSKGSCQTAVIMCFLMVLLMVLPGSMACPKACACSAPLPIPIRGVKAMREGRTGLRMACISVGLSAVPQLKATNDFNPKAITSLDLSNNNLTTLPDHAFSTYPRVHYLKLSGNRLTSLSAKALHGLPLQTLYLDTNHLSGLLTGSLPTTLLDLSLEDNFFSQVPPCVALLNKLQALNLARNKITILRNGDLQGLSSLVSLSVHENELTTVETEALVPLPHLQLLDLTENKLTEVPEAVLRCPHLTRLLLGNNQLSYVGRDAFKDLEYLEQVALQGNPIFTVHREAFTNLPSLTKLILKEMKELTDFPSLNGTHNLEQLRIDRSALTNIPDSLCSFSPKLRSLNLHLNSITNIPDLAGCSHLKLLDLSNNAVRALGHSKFVGAPQLQDLLLQDNRIKHIATDAFAGLEQLQVLNLQQNQITEIEEDAFLPLISLEDINLGDNAFSELPHRGLEHILSIKVHNNRYLRVFPGRESFPHVRSLTLSYAYHCCPFLSQEDEITEEIDEEQRINEDVLFDISDFQGMHPALWNTSRPLWNASKPWNEKEGMRSNFGALWANLAAAFPSAPGNVTATTSNDLSTPDVTTESPSHQTGLPVTPIVRLRPQCIPLPGPFMPCRDLFDWWTLRCGVWIVFLLALMGNAVVVVVLVAAYAKMDVPRFLVTNLALADFFMGIYLGFLAVADASTLGEFRMYAIPWQMSPACQVAGFLGVLSSELSVYTLAVITLERNYAITHAMHLQKRLSLNQAAYIMAIGWVFALTMAVLPLAGVSDYRKFAVCLPFETDGAGLGYVVFLMFINGVAFLILMGCYFKIYCAIRGSQAWNSNDSRIAKRMALLVFTDLICWAPIAFFSLTAAFDIHLISLEEAKVFTVFILPLNSCCNPFLYALLTKQFKKDCVMLCKTIEESRVTRGIGRCRHSSNFSNRQTPANTNSAIDQTSQDERNSCSCKGKQDKKKQSRWSFASLKYLLCTKGAEELTSSSDMSYQTQHAGQRGPRHTSLSSDTYSGSWSDTWRRGRGPVTLKMLERRRNNSWAASHKPSQESSLSNSRPDSSATSASTATWRISRSSVSSDTSNSSGKIKANENATQSRLGSLRDRRAENRPFGATRPLVQSPLVREPPMNRSPTVRPKPRLQRQVAVEKESYIPFKDVGGTETQPCPFHLRPDHLSCVYEQESHEEDIQIPTSSQSGSPNLQPTILLTPCGLENENSDTHPESSPKDQQQQSPLKSPTEIIQINLPQSHPTTPEDLSTTSDAELTALMAASADNEGQKQTADIQANKILETHFPLESTIQESHPLI